MQTIFFSFIYFNKIKKKKILTIIFVFIKNEINQNKSN